MTMQKSNAPEIQYILTDNTLSIFDTSQIPYLKSVSVIGSGSYSLGRSLINLNRIKDLAFFTRVGHNIIVTSSITIQSTLASSLNVFLNKTPSTILGSFLDDFLINSSKALNGEPTSIKSAESIITTINNITVPLEKFMLCEKVIPISASQIRIMGKRFSYKFNLLNNSVYTSDGKYVCLHPSYDKQHLYNYTSPEQEKSESIFCKIVACLNDDKPPLDTFLK